MVTAAGRPGWLKREMLSPSAVVVDVGTSADGSGKIRGDADFEGIKDFVKAVSPVPGGVGPVTLACLLQAVVRAAGSKEEK